MKIHIVSLLSTLLLLGGCGLFKSKDVPYRDSVNRAPLQVPADLDQPVVDDALRVPESGSSGSPDIRVTDRTTTAPLAGGDLVLSDSAEGAWRRVGVALSRLGEDVSVADGDEAAGRYRVEIVTRQRSDGFFRRLFRRGGGSASERVIVQLEPVAEGVRVTTVERSAGARLLLERLRQRLG